MKAGQKIKRKKAASDFIIPAILIAVFIAALFIYKIQAAKQYIEISNSAERAMYIAFEKIDDIFRETENVVHNNREIMINGFDDIDKSELVQIVRDIERIKLSAPYVNDVVLYKKDGDMLITSTGTADKKSFMQFSYAIDNKMLEKFDEVADSYLVSSVIALDAEKGDSNKSRDMFVVPKKSDLYDVNMLVFVNEKDLIDFCGISKKNKLWNTALLDKDLKTVMSSSRNPRFGKENAANLKNESQYYSGGLFKPFTYTKWFEYGDMLYHIEINNYMSLIFVSAIAVTLAVTGIFLTYYRSRRFAAAIGTNAYNKRTVLHCALTMPHFAAENSTMLEKLFDLGQNKTLYLISVIFIDVQDSKTVPPPEKICLMPDDGHADLMLAETGKKRYSGIAAAKSDVSVNEILLKIIKEISSKCSVVIVRSEGFNKLSDISSVHSSVKYIANNYNLTKINCVITEADCIYRENQHTLNNIRPALVNLMGNGSVRDITKYITELISNEIEDGGTFDSFILFIKTLYANLMSVVDEKLLETSEFHQVKEIFWQSIEEYSDNLSVNSIKSAFLNMVVMITANKKIKEKDDTAEKILTYVNRNYKNDLYLDKVAHEFGFTGKNLSAYFKRHFNIGFNEYLTHLRIEEAKRLLSDTDEGVQNIAGLVGYANSATFNSAFKKLTGMSPSAYREQARNSGAEN